MKGKGIHMIGRKKSISNSIKNSNIKNSTVKQTVSVNGDSISIINNKLYINGKEYKFENGNVSELEIKGNVSSINSDCSITINGDVAGDVDVGGSVNVVGNVTGDIDAGGSVNISGRHKGDIDAGGSVSIIGG
jgi:hypothetical protein